MTTERKKEGKARSSHNATKHGLLANTVLLPGESQQEFQQLLHSLIQTYRPVTDAEARLVEQLAAVTWFQLRLLGIETETLATRMELQATVLDAHLTSLSPSRRIALAYAELADTSRIPLNLDRHSTRLGRQLDRLHNQLIRLQSLRPQPNLDPGPAPDTPNTEFPNEPTDEQPLSPEPLTGPDSKPAAAAAPQHGAPSRPSAAPPNRPPSSPRQKPRVAKCAAGKVGRPETSARIIT